MVFIPQLLFQFFVEVCSLPGLKILGAHSPEDFHNAVQHVHMILNVVIHIAICMLKRSLQWLGL
jgi:hypothetical protein